MQMSNLSRNQVNTCIAPTQRGIFVAEGHIPLSLFLPKRLACGDLRKGKYDPRIGHDRVRPPFFRRLREQVEVFLGHLDINLNRSFHALLYLPFSPLRQGYS